ncbi:MAG: hypothetical protein WAV28_07050 [Sedimentisphaerales bacterium]
MMKKSDYELTLIINGKKVLKGNVSELQKDGPGFTRCYQYSYLDAVIQLDISSREKRNGKAKNQKKESSQTNGRTAQD